MACSNQKPLRLKASGRTDRGLVRSQNEDDLYIDDDHRIYAVADGLGGLPEGSLASQLAVTSIRDYLEQDPQAEEIDYAALFNFINRRVQEEGARVSHEIGIGSTLTLAHIQGSTLNIAHVGDTGLLLFRDGNWIKLTVDHTMAQEMRDRLHPGENAYIPEYFSHTLTRCVGQAGILTPDVYTHDIAPGDRILLYSDGVTKVIQNDELRDLLKKATDPGAATEHIIRLGNERGGPDNITAIALFMDQDK